MDLTHSDDWKPAVAAYLEDRTQVFLAAVALAVLDRSYGEMTLDDWRRLSGVMKALGWRSRKIGSAKVWRPAPMNEPAPKLF